MKFLFFILLVGAPSLIHGIQNDKDSLPMSESKLIEPNQILHDYTVYTGCGGVIPLSPLFDSKISYKEGKLFDPYEFCVWSLLPGDQVTNVRVFVHQNMTSDWDGITVYFMNTTGLTTLKLPGTSAEFNFNTPLAFLVFNSHHEVEANGFYIEIFSTGDSGPTSSAAYHTRKNKGEFVYPVTNQDKGMGLVLQKNTTGWVGTSLEVNLGNVRIGERDSIQVYSLSRYYYSPNPALIGSFTTDARFQAHAHYPVLILLQSESKNLTGKGFQVEWKEYPHSVE